MGLPIPLQGHVTDDQVLLVLPDPLVRVEGGGNPNDLFAVATASTAQGSRTLPSDASACAVSSLLGESNSQGAELWSLYRDSNPRNLFRTRKALYLTELHRHTVSTDNLIRPFK